MKPIKVILYEISMTPSGNYKVIMGGQLVAVKDTYTKAIRAANKAARKLA